MRVCVCVFVCVHACECLYVYACDMLVRTHIFLHMPQRVFIHTCKCINIDLV